MNVLGDFSIEYPNMVIWIKLYMTFVRDTSYQEIL